MNPASGALLSWAYILGLLSTAILGLPNRDVPWKDYSLLIVGAIVLGIVSAIAIPRFWRRGPGSGLWLTGGIIAALAIFYFHTRIPQPTATDISQFVNSGKDSVQGQVVTVQGKVETMPRLTRSSKGQFWLKVTQLNEVESNGNNGANSHGVTGRLYVTVPLLQATGIYPDQTISVTGVLYKPKPVKNPGAFDFHAYLAKEGVFAGLSGRQISGIDEQKEPPWGWWILQQRITRAQVNWLGSPVGQLLSSMVLGNRAVDIPYNIRDQFVQVGLAHALAASGTQTSLILGWIVALTRRFSAKTQLVLGSFGLIIFIGLSGMQPSILRAAIMGFGALLALVTERKIKPLGSLLVAGTILLIFNPLWIWDLGFQLSFLATLGLLVTVPPLMKQFDWLPSGIAAIIAVPLGAALWTLPLQLYVFGIVAPYSTIVNIISAPLIGIISLGGFISGIIALISPIAGSAVAWILYYPIQLLLGLVQVFGLLPGNQIALGTITIWQLLLLYILICLSCVIPRVRQRWWLAGLLAVTVVLLPFWQTKIEQFQVSVLATDEEQVLVIQDKGQVALVNSGEADTASFTVLPFLQKQGVNQIDWAVALDSQPRLRGGWVSMLESLPVRTFYDSVPQTVSRRANEDAELTDPKIQESTPSRSAIASALKSQKGKYQEVSKGQTLSVASTTMKLISADPPILQLQIKNLSWLLVGEMKTEIQAQLVKSGNLPQTQVLWWSGEALIPELVESLKPEIAIASSNIIDPEMVKLLLNSKIDFYWTGRDGAIQWTVKEGFETTIDANRDDAALL
ncbi:MAG TPA: competence protein [Cyanobacteria bacterium UBA11149]|nr:competence protein [Cyanobacteria bacterium UBA11367]HBE57175.1 competence protein [Cyanobacteria bacterium UBA11366]HBK66184.1 competence protein [Cyanobacteria bacterium UBA11166]HBR73667.1 competence protein [Cyanobacteria bacterium UBA11159]HBS71462.1 competence protein [Cyanobacteria bacterium UBA11153]HBW89154.1 competence protein [Cyanobacteria bacterium UBA11149]HCA94707.1 competence protein [Cyanobacteria bacterium UBA9226]